MTDVIGGLLMVVGGGMLSATSVSLARAHPKFTGELLAALPFTPTPQPDPELDALLHQLD